MANPFAPGQCTHYAYDKSLELTGIELPVTGDASTWYTSVPRSMRSSVPTRFGCVACWSGGTNGWGHVGVVESMNGSLMLYSDCNYEYPENPGTVITHEDITEAEMKRLFGSSFSFQGYIIPD